LVFFFPKQLLGPSSAFVGIVNIDIMIFRVERLLYEGLLEFFIVNDDVIIILFDDVFIDFAFRGLNLKLLQ